MPLTKQSSMRIIITGGAGFIGSALVRYLIQHTDHTIANIDKLTYAGHLRSLASVTDHPRYCFYEQDISDAEAITAIFDQFKPDAVMHLAAESHVDRSISGAAPFIQTNIIGTYVLLEAARHYWQKQSTEHQKRFRFHHISTDEVYGDLGHSTALFSESSPYAPNSPYSATKASADHLVRAWHRTYGLPILISNSSNNYGPYHFPEKLIPHLIINALHHNPLPLYGNGLQRRDWLYVEDHVQALLRILEHGQVGETYNIGGNSERSNLEVAHHLCRLLDQLQPWTAEGKTRSYAELIQFVADRPGHDIRYAIDASKIKKTLGWSPTESFESGLRKTVQWYLQHPDWWQPLWQQV